MYDIKIKSLIYSVKKENNDKEIKNNYCLKNVIFVNQSS